MQKIEHIQWYAKIVANLLTRPHVHERQFWEGARDALNWVLEPESEVFDPRFLDPQPETTAIQEENIHK
jgi:hypothetical protein